MKRAALRLDEPAAVEGLFDRYHGPVYGLAMSILKNKHDAEEAAQEVFLTVLRKADRFQGNPAITSIYRICVNACLMRLRQGRRTETVPIEEFLPVFTRGARMRGQSRTGAVKSNAGSRRGRSGR